MCFTRSPALVAQATFYIVNFSNPSLLLSPLPDNEHVDCRTQGQQVMEQGVPDHNGVGYSTRGPQGDGYRPRGQLQRHHTIQTSDDAYVSLSRCHNVLRLGPQK